MIKDDYKVIKFYQDGRKSQVIKRNLTLEKAQKICQDPETSSKTCKLFQSPTIQKNLDNSNGHWFYGYTDK